MKSIFINNNRVAGDWIIAKIAEDIKREAESSGYLCRMGGYADYQAEDICYHIYYNLAIPFKSAKHNSVFITHTDDCLKERELLRIKDDFDSFICMSPEDAQFLIELGFDKAKVFGMALPVRNNYVRPVSIGIFSACYPDGRKNEQWLIDFCRLYPEARLLNFVFIGAGWEKVLQKLQENGCSFEWHNVSRKLPYEYQFQQNKLSGLDYYIYMGMDGGAMGTYDAYAMGSPLCVTYDGFHKSIPFIDYTFDSIDSFKKQILIIAKKQEERINFFLSHTNSNYFKWLERVWNNMEDNVIENTEIHCLSYDSVVEKRRKQYFPITLYRIKRIVYNNWRRIQEKSKRNLHK